MSCDPGTASSTIEKNRIGQEEGAVLQFFFTVQWKSFGASARSDVLLMTALVSGEAAFQPFRIVPPFMWSDFIPEDST
jgi:hypothetical protein